MSVAYVDATGLLPENHLRTPTRPVAPVNALADTLACRPGGLPGQPQGAIAISVAGQYSLEQAAQALEQARRGARGAAIVLRPGDLG
jgi:hypothetical protein